MSNPTPENNTQPQIETTGEKPQDSNKAEVSANLGKKINITQAEFHAELKKFTEVNKGKVTNIKETFLLKMAFKLNGVDAKANSKAYADLNPEQKAKVDATIKQLEPIFNADKELQAKVDETTASFDATVNQFNQPTPDELKTEAAVKAFEDHSADARIADRASTAKQLEPKPANYTKAAGADSQRVMGVEKPKAEVPKASFADTEKVGREAPLPISKAAGADSSQAAVEKNQPKEDSADRRITDRKEAAQAKSAKPEAGLKQADPFGVMGKAIDGIKKVADSDIAKNPVYAASGAETTPQTDYGIDKLFTPDEALASTGKERIQPSKKIETSPVGKFGEVIKIETNQTWLKELSVMPVDKAVFAKAKELGIKIVDVGPTSGKLNIVDKNGVTIGYVDATSRGAKVAKEVAALLKKQNNDAGVS